MIGGKYVKGNAIPTEEALHLFGRQLKEKRLALNVTQAQVEAQSGVSLTVIKRLESGKPITTDKLIKLLKAYSLLSELLSVFEPEEISLENKWKLMQKNSRNKRKRSSPTTKKTDHKDK